MCERVNLCFLCLLFGSFPFVCFVQFQCVSFCFIFIVFYYYPLEAFCFLIDRKGVDPDGRGGGEELGGGERGKTVIRIYYVRQKKKSIFSKRKKIK